MWWFDGALNFVPILGVPLAIAGLAALAVHRWHGRRTWTLIACMPLLTWALFLGSAQRYYAIGGGCSAPLASGLRVVTANVMMQNRELPELARDVLAQQPDVIVFEELQERLEAFSPALASEYPYRISTATPWVTIASRLPLQDAHALALPEPVSGREPLMARISLDGNDVTLLAVHEVVPLDALTARQHAAQLAALARAASTATGPIVGLGDFNATIFSPSFESFLGESGLRIASLSRWQAATHVPRPILGVRIDHVLLRAAQVCDEDVFTLSGSDHRGVAATLSIGPAALARAH